MEGSDADMEVDVTIQQDNESIRKKMTSSWKIKINLILNKYQIKNLTY
jgi:hypothetical protein